MYSSPTPPVIRFIISTLYKLHRPCHPHPTIKKCSQAPMCPPNSAHISLSSRIPKEGRDAVHTLLHQSLWESMMLGQGGGSDGGYKTRSVGGSSSGYDRMTGGPERSRLGVIQLWVCTAQPGRRLVCLKLWRMEEATVRSGENLAWSRGRASLEGDIWVEWLMGQSLVRPPKCILNNWLKSSFLSTTFRIFHIDSSCYSICLSVFLLSLCLKVFQKFHIRGLNNPPSNV